MSVGHTYKFFGFSISYTILNLPLSILYLPFMLLTPCTFSPILPFPLLADNPPNDLHIYDSVPVLLVGLVCVDSLDSCEVFALSTFIVLIFFFLDKPL